MTALYETLLPGAEVCQPPRPSVAQRHFHRRRGLDGHGPERLEARPRYPVGVPPDAEHRERPVLAAPQHRGRHPAQGRLELARRDGIAAVADLTELAEQPGDIGDGGVGEALESRAEHTARLP